MTPRCRAPTFDPAARDELADVSDGVPLLTQLGYAITADESRRGWATCSRRRIILVLVAEIDGRVVGLVHVFVRPAIENPREAVVQALVVHDAHRRAGVGRMLMAAAERWGNERGCRSVVLSSNVARAPAHAFYAALGYRVAATSLILRKPLPAQ